jgi:hypothetical protein
MLTIHTEAFEDHRQLAAALRLALAGEPNPFRHRLEVLVRELMWRAAAPPEPPPAPLMLVPLGRCRFQTAGGIWEPRSVLPAFVLVLTAAFPNRWWCAEVGVEKLPALRAAVKRAHEGLARLDARFGDVFCKPEGHSGPGLHFRSADGFVMVQLRVRGHTQICMAVT